MEKNTKEADMVKREIKPDYKYVEKLYAVYPLLGDAVISEKNLEKIYTQAKRALDELVETPSLYEAVSLDWHLFITLATVNYAKKWNASDESKFTKYITMQFGYRDDSGKVWNVLSRSIERAFGAKSRFFLKDKGGREFFETIIIHSFGPENAWNSVFDLLYDFLKNNLRWNYIKSDPILPKMIAILKARLDGDVTDDDELVISSMEYRVKLGARRLIQNRPEYTSELFDHILNRIYDLIHTQQGETKIYVDVLMDEWFARKVSRMMEGEKHQITKVSKLFTDTALSYAKIRVYVYMNGGRLWLHVPAIRLEKSENKYAEVRVFESNKLVGHTNLEIYGNELGETISEIEIQLSLSNTNKCNINVKIICDGDEIFDSKQTLYRKLFVFKKGKETNINSIKPGIYEMYIPDIDNVVFTNTDILHKDGKYLELELRDDFAITRGEKIIAMDTSNIQEAQISEPTFLQSCLYMDESETYEIALASDTYKIFIDKKKSSNSIYFFCNRTQIELGPFCYNGEKENTIYEIPLERIIEVETVTEVSIIDLESNSTLYKRSFYVAQNISVEFNRIYYVRPEDYSDAKAVVCITGDKKEILFSNGDTELSLEYLEGTLLVKIPAVCYKWIHLNNMYPGNSIWKEDILSNTRLVISSPVNISSYIEIANHKFRENEIVLSRIIEDEKNSASFNCPVILSVNDEKYKIAQIIYSDMFIRMPVFTSDGIHILWDGGINFIGNKSSVLELCLYNEDELVYKFPLRFDINEVTELQNFEDREYTYLIIKVDGHSETTVAQDIQFFGNPNKLRFENKVIQIDKVTEDVAEGTKPQSIKSVYIDKIKFVKRDFVPSEDDVFDIYEGQMYFLRYDGSKKYYSFNYSESRNGSFYKVNPVLIIYINDRFLRIINEDEEGLYCYDNFGTTPRLEITDREPALRARNYKDVLFYVYGTNSREKRIATNEVLSIHPNLSNTHSIFDKFEEMQQEEVILAPSLRRMLINAGPGTGKTWTLIERIINLVDYQGVDPETILVICFSKAAVEVIRGRLADAASQDRVSEVINQVDVRTFDSFASQLLYWVKDDSEYDNLQYYEIGRLSYEERIKLFISLVKDLPELISQCAHFIVDEVQDLVKDRARMVLEMIRSIPPEAGVTLMGDSCQSIYDYQIGNDSMSSNQFYKVMCERMDSFNYCTFMHNYRQDDDLAKVGDNYRRVILSGNLKKCDEYWNSIVEKHIPKYEVYDVTSINTHDLSILKEDGTVGILTRTNGQALKISAALREKGIEHSLRKRLSDNSLNKWIALIFNEYNHTSINEEEFVDAYRTVYQANKGNSEEDVWNVLRDTARTSVERIGVREILHGLKTNARSMLLFSEENDSQLTVTNIHRGKGREFDTVLVEDSIFAEEEKSLEEHKVCYVAITRPKKSVYRIDAKAEFMRIDKEGDRRCFKSDFGRNGKPHLSFFEVGLGYDLDYRSFVRTEGIQQFIRQNHRDLIGKRVYLLKDIHFTDYVPYKIILTDSGMEIGKTSREFYECLTRAIRLVYKLPACLMPYFNVFPSRLSDIYIEDVISVVDQADGSENGVFNYGEMVTWNAINIVGYSRVEYI